MDTPADPATPLAEVYQAFLADLAKECRCQVILSVLTAE